MTAVPMPSGMQAQRWQPDRVVQLPEGLGQAPLIHPEDPKAKQVQEVWEAKVKTFDLSKDEDCAAYEKVWQGVCDGTAKMCDHQMHFVEKKGAYVAVLRWANLSYKLGGS